MPPISLLTEQDAAHFLRRTAFGPTVDEIRALVGLPRAAVVELAVPLVAPPAPAFPVDRNRTDHWAMHTEVAGWWVNQMVTSPTPIVEHLALFWHNHFVSGFDKVEQMDVMWDQHVLFRTVGLGNFTELTKKVSLGGAMLRYLDNEVNRAGTVQENFGRELMELFTCGVGHYSEDDVLAMSRAWTGHGTVGWNGTKHDLTYRFRPEHHDHGDKTLFGITRNWDATATIDELCTGSKAIPTSKRIAKKLYEYFIRPNPTDATVSALAKVFRDSGLDMLTLVRAVLLHEDFWSLASRRTIVKHPVHYMADVLRLTSTSLEPGSMRWLMTPMGQVLFDPPDVSGWGDNDYWLSTATAWGRADFAQRIRWNLGDAGFLTAIEDRSLPADQAARTAFAEFGVLDPSVESITRVADQITLLRNKHSWAVRPNVFTLICVSPEVQVR